MLSISVATWYWSTNPFFSTVSADPPLASFSRIMLLTLTISASLCVRSSSCLCPDSCLTDGRTDGGGTGRCVHMNRSGLAKRGSSPMMLLSSSVMRLSILSVSSAVSISSLDSVSPVVGFHNMRNRMSSHLDTESGLRAPHPFLVAAPHLFTRAQSLVTVSHLLMLETVVFLDSMA